MFTRFQPVAFRDVTQDFHSNDSEIKPVGVRSCAVPLIAFCHLSWNWVWQRPQQFLSRLSEIHPLLFVETYCSDTAFPYVKSWRPKNHEQVTILEMHFPSSKWPDGAFIDSQRLVLMKEYLLTEEGSRFSKAILWFNDPMAVTSFAGQLEEKLIVYDCMDELTQFKNPPVELADRERSLTLAADLIFCGGRAMRDKRLPFNPNTHFYGTGVDCAHFGKAMIDTTAPHLLMAGMRRPLLGYFGVIDERIDYGLIAAIVDAHPEWDVVMIGPFAKVSEEEIPKRPNLHWVGSQPYSDLPALTRHMDICLMPFALNEATEYINPTKALEYMAAGKPVVSTPIREVLTNFGRICHVAHDHRQFIAVCERILSSSGVERIERGLELASQNTWEAIVAKMEIHIQDAMTVRSDRRNNGSSVHSRDQTSALSAHV